MPVKPPEKAVPVSAPTVGTFCLKGMFLLFWMIVYEPCG